jgi:hypothetical protein
MAIPVKNAFRIQGALALAAIFLDLAVFYSDGPYGP